ncbi:MAG: hypothetical protein ACM31C_10730 [Acidobacteriota bacterium]
MRVAGCVAIVGLMAAAAHADPPEELNIFGVYATAMPQHNHQPRGKVTVEVERLAPQTLVIGAYDETDWEIVPAPGAQLRRVIVTGFKSQSVHAPASVKVDVLAGPGKYLAAAGNPGWGSGLGEGHAALVTAAEELTGLAATSYHGCGRATKVTQTASGAFAADCTEGWGNQIKPGTVVHAMPPLLPVVADAYVRFRARLVARCGSWNAPSCPAEGAMIVVDQAAREAGVRVELARTPQPVRVLPLRVPPKTPVAIDRGGTRERLAVKPGEIWVIAGSAGVASRFTAPDGTLGLAGDRDLLDQLVGAAGGAICMGGCELRRDRAGLFFLLDWLASFDDLPISLLEVTAK